MNANWQHTQELERMVKREFPREYDRASRPGITQLIPLPDGSLLKLSATDRAGAVLIETKTEEIAL
jgi:hypothetical protein